jgi:hypothetical protein
MQKVRPSTCADRERAFTESFVIDPAKRYLLHNRTPERICVADDAHGEVRLAPLAQRVVQGARLAPFEDLLVPLRQRHQLRVREYTEANRSIPLQLVVWGAVLGLLGVVIVDALVHGTLARAEAVAALAVLTAVVVTVLVLSVTRERGRRRDEEIADVEEGDIEFGVGGAYYNGNETVPRTKDILTLLVVIVIGAVLPALAIFVATDAKELVAMEGGLRIKDGLESRFVSRAIQVVYTAVLSLFPALLYFQFDRQRVGTIRGKWVRAIFRMDRQMRTLADVNARYGDELAEASSYSTDSVRFLGGRNSPIIVATILVSLGWTLLVVRTESFDFAGATKVAVVAESADEAAQRANAAASTASEADLATRAATADSAASAAARASETAAEIAAESVGDTVPSAPTTAPRPPEPSQNAIEEDAASATASAEDAAVAEAAVRQPFFQLLVPTPSAATMAFLGAYFFAVYLALRGYFRGDLRPKIYNQITARLVTVVVLAYLITVLFSDSGERNRVLWVAAFLAGVVPATVLQRLGLAASSVFGSSPSEDDDWLRRASAQAFATPRSLTQIDGIDIYESSRLESEGITDVASLAKSDLVSMMINTRLPVERLVDWSDQAVLIVLLDDGRDEEPDERVARLRSIGIRTASGLRAVASAGEADGTRQAVERLLAGDMSPDGRSLLQWLAAQISAEPSIRRIQQWHDSELADVDQDCPTIEERGGWDADAGAGASRAGGSAEPPDRRIRSATRRSLLAT